MTLISHRTPTSTGDRHLSRSQGRLWVGPFAAATEEKGEGGEGAAPNL